MIRNSYYNTSFISSHELRLIKKIADVQLHFQVSYSYLFVTARSITLFIIPTFSLSIRRRFVRMQQTDAHASEKDRGRERVLARQPGVSGRCTPMLACQREFDAPRHPLTSFYPISRSRVIPPPVRRRHRCNNGRRPDQIFVLRKLDRNLSSLTTMELFLTLVTHLF